MMILVYTTSPVSMLMLMMHLLFFSLLARYHVNWCRLPATMARGTWAGGIPSWRGSFFLELLDCWLGLSFPWTFSESKLLLGLVAVFGSVLEVSTFSGSCAPLGTLSGTSARSF